MWSNFWDQQLYQPNLSVHSIQNLEPWLQVSRRAFDLGHEFGRCPVNLSHSATGYLDHGSDPETMEPEAVRTLVQFSVSHGADTEQVEGHYHETALLSAAHSGGKSSSLGLRALLEHGADHTVRDYFGRGPLNLTLKKERSEYEESEGPPATSMRLMEAKLVCLIRAGCPIHEVDGRGATPTDLARENCMRIVWENALREVNMLDDKMLELLDEKVRQYYLLGPPRTDNKFWSMDTTSCVRLIYQKARASLLRPISKLSYSTSRWHTTKGDFTGGFQRRLLLWPWRF